MNRRGFVKALGLVPVGVALSTIVTESPGDRVFTQEMLDRAVVELERIEPEPFDGRVYGSMYEANARSQGWDGEEMNHHYVTKYERRRK